MSALTRAHKSGCVHCADCMHQQSHTRVGPLVYFRTLRVLICTHLPTLVHHMHAARPHSGSHLPMSPCVACGSMSAPLHTFAIWGGYLSGLGCTPVVTSTVCAGPCLGKDPPGEQGDGPGTLGTPWMQPGVAPGGSPQDQGPSRCLLMGPSMPLDLDAEPVCSCDHG